MNKCSIIALIMFVFIMGACKSDDYNIINETKIKSSVEAEFNKLINAAREVDINLILSFYSDDVTAIEQGVMHKSPEEFKTSYREAVGSVKTVHRIDVENPRFKVLSPEVVLYEVKLNQDITLKSDDRIQAVNFLSLIYKLENGKWKIIHHHGSFPTN